MTICEFNAYLCFFLCRISPNDHAEVSVPIQLSGVQRDGSEQNILNCPNSPVIPPTVSHLQDAYAVCRPQNHTYSGIKGNP